MMNYWRGLKLRVRLNKAWRYVAFCFCVQSNGRFPLIVKTATIQVEAAETRTVATNKGQSSRAFKQALCKPAGIENEPSNRDPCGTLLLPVAAFLEISVMRAL